MSEHPHAIPNDWLVLYYDGELDAQRRAQVQAHLKVCIRCQQELDALNRLSSLLSADRLGADALTNGSVRAAWRELQPRLPERAAAAPFLLRWLPGIGLLIANVLVEFIALASLVMVLAASQLGWLAQSVDWLDGALSGWWFGWITWLLPIPQSGWGWSLFLVILSAWLAVLYLAGLGYVCLERRQPASATQSVFE